MLIAVDKLVLATCYLYNTKLFIIADAAFLQNLSTHTLGIRMCIRIPNTGQLNPLFHTSAEFGPIVNGVVVRQSTDWLAANAQFSPYDFVVYHVY